MKPDNLKKFGFWLLEYTCPPFLHEEVRGDLEELYNQRLKTGGEIRAGLFLIWEAATSVRLQALARKKAPHTYQKDHFAMISHYLKVAFRNLRRQKSYNFLNIGGLAIGLASFLMIALYVHHELSYDTWMADSERIYRIPMEITTEGNTRKFSQIAAPVAPALKQDYPQVEETLRIWKRPTRLVRLPDNQMFYEENVYYAEPSFFEFFSLEMIEGEPASVLNRPNTVVLSKSAADRFFGMTPALGKSLEINDQEFEVTGVMENTPENTHHDFNLLISWATRGEGLGEALENWYSTMFTTYVKLRKGTNTDLFGESIANLANRYVADGLERLKASFHYHLQPVSEIHLNPDYYDEAKPGGSATTVYIFSVIALMALLIASLNFVNLSTARAETRAKEVGMRKVLGARRFTLLGQHMGEALCYSFLSLMAAILIFGMTLPWYNQLVGIDFQIDMLLNPTLMIGFLAITILTGLGAGFYPALVLSSFSPLSMFRNRGGRKSRGTLLRKVLVVGQFAISVVLIVGTITVYKQLHFMMDKELGFETDQMLVLPIRGSLDLSEQYDPIKSEFGSLASVESATISSYVPGSGISNFYIRIDREENDMAQSMYHLFVDYDFTETYDLDIIAGRDFSRDYGNDGGDTFLINEAAVASLEWSSPEEALGHVLESGAGGFKAEIVGVFKDFHYRSVDQVVDPLVLNIRDGRLNVVTLRLNTENIPGTIDQVRATWSTLFPAKAFDYFFLDERFNAQYNNYERTGNILLTFSLLAIFIACLGLYGLAAFSAQQRTKEIGIRKVLGASVSSLILTISGDFLILVLIAVGLAVPVSWWLVSSWLQQFVYRITPGLSIFLVAGLIAILITIFTVSWQSVRAALANPVKSLRTE